MMLQRFKTIGAPLAQTGLLQQAEIPTHGVVAGARNNAPPCVGAVLAQTASRVSHQIRYTPAALCLRRRSLPHRYQLADEAIRGPHPVMHIDIQQHRSRSIPRRWLPGLAERVMDSFLRAGRYLGASITRTNPWPSYRLTVPHASRSPLAWACGSHIPLSRNETRRRHHLCADQRGVCTRALSTRNPCKAPSQKNLAGTGGGEENARLDHSRPNRLLSRLPFPKSGPARFQKVGELTHGI
jgi:hypothetical protein